MPYQPLGINLNREYRNSLNAQLKELFERIGNIIANAGDSNLEVVDARLGIDDVVRHTLGDFIRELQQEIIDLQAGGGSQEQIDALALRVTDIENAISGKANQSDLTNHLNDSVRHVTQADKNTWNGKQNALGYSPVNKAGDTMSGNLVIDNAAPNIVFNYNGVIKGNFYYLAGDDCLYLFNRDGASTYRGGFRFKPDKNVDIYDGATYRKIWHAGNAGPFYVGLGSPEGVVVAPVGALYQRTDGAASTTLYVKELGTGNVGWKAK